MPVRSAGVSGLAVTLVTAGSVVLWSGIRNATVADTLRGFISGRPVAPVRQETAFSRAVAQAVAATAAVTSQPQQGLSPAGGRSGSAIVDDARQYVGRTPYVWGGSSATGADCSGLVNLVLGHDLGLPIPGHEDGHYSGHGPDTGSWYFWSGAVTVPPDQAQPGDLVCWLSHIGIYVGGGRMINAPTFGRSVEEAPVWRAPAPLYRRLKPRQGLAAA
jgi:cell wall-associated NlpC family hydrolase